MQRRADNPTGGMRQRAISAASDAKRELTAASEQARILKTVSGVDEAARYLADRFNGMRAELGEFVALMREGQASSERFVRAAKAISCGDYGMLLDGGRCVRETFDVEDAGLFAHKLKEVTGLVKFENRLKACCELNELIGKAIDGWQSKIDKMKERTSANGATEAELRVAETKIVQFGVAIEILRKRGSEVSALYYDTKRAIAAVVAKADARFRVINWNEDPGHKSTDFQSDQDMQAGREISKNEKGE